MTATLTLSGDQILSLFEQLEPREKRQVLYKLAEAAGKRRGERMTTTESKLREASAQRGLSWDQMSESERLDFVDQLVHEDR